MSRHRRQRLRRQRRAAAGHEARDQFNGWPVRCLRAGGDAFISHRGSCSACGQRITALAAVHQVALRTWGCS